MSTAFSAIALACLSGCQTPGIDSSLFSQNSSADVNGASAVVYGIDQLENGPVAFQSQQQSTTEDNSTSKIDVHETRNSELLLGSAEVFAGGDANNSMQLPGIVERPVMVATPQRQSVASGNDDSNVVVRGQSPITQSGQARQTTYQYPLNQQAPGIGSQNSVAQLPSIGSPNELSPLDSQGLANFPQNYADIDVYLSETQTGRINFGGAYNSDNGIVGQFTIDERNFDIWRFPRSFRDISDGTAWRGAGQTFRLELVPGNEVQRYLVSFGEPYLFNTPVSLTASAYLFDRRYFDYSEQRLGGRLALGYRLNHDLSVSFGFRGEDVNIYDPRVNTSPDLNATVGSTDLFVGHVGLIRDTRDHPFMATQGGYLAMTYHQAFGEYSYARGDIDFRRYRLLYERPDGSGRHTLSFGSKVGFSGKDTPVFENYFAGGFSTLRGFDFRGAAPVQGGVVVGGPFQWLNSLEYMFPLTADDMVRGVVFCDFGTVEESVTLNAENYRVAPGFGFRVNMPAAGIGAPLAFDFAFPVSKADTDQTQTFSFYLGVTR